MGLTGRLPQRGAGLETLGIQCLRSSRLQSVLLSSVQQLASLLIACVSLSLCAYVLDLTLPLKLDRSRQVDHTRLYLCWPRKRPASTTPTVPSRRLGFSGAYTLFRVDNPAHFALQPDSSASSLTTPRRSRKPSRQAHTVGHTSASRRKVVTVFPSRSLSPSPRTPPPPSLRSPTRDRLLHSPASEAGSDAASEFDEHVRRRVCSMCTSLYMLTRMFRFDTGGLDGLATLSTHSRRPTRARKGHRVTHRSGPSRC